MQNVALEIALWCHNTFEKDIKLYSQVTTQDEIAYWELLHVSMIHNLALSMGSSVAEKDEI